MVHLRQGDVQCRDVVRVIALAEHPAEVLLIAHRAGVGRIGEVGRIDGDADDVVAGRRRLRGVIEHEVLPGECAHVDVGPAGVDALITVLRECSAGAVDPTLRIDARQKRLAVVETEASFAGEDRSAEGAALEYREELVRRVVLVVKVIVAGGVLEQAVAVVEVAVVIRIDVREGIADDRVGIADVGSAHGKAEHAMKAGSDSVFDRRARSGFHLIAADRPRARESRGVDDEVCEAIEIGDAVITACRAVGAAGGEYRREKQWCALNETKQSHSCDVKD